MKYRILIIFLVIFFITSCKSWEVVQKLEINTYHIYNTRTKSVEVISTKKKLEIGKLYSKSSLDIINIDDIDPTIE